MQISADEYREIRRRRTDQKSRYEQGKTSKVETTKPRVTSRILLNKWQRQKEKDYQHWLKDQAYQHQLKQERFEREQAELHWHCPFFRHCWNEGLKLPTRHDCPEYSNQYQEYRQSQTNRRSIHAQDAYHHNNIDRCLKKWKCSWLVQKKSHWTGLGWSWRGRHWKKIHMVGRPVVPRRFDEKPKEEGAAPKEQRDGTGSSTR